MIVQVSAIAFVLSSFSLVSSAEREAIIMINGRLPISVSGLSRSNPVVTIPLNDVPEVLAASIVQLPSFDDLTLDRGETTFARAEGIEKMTRGHGKDGDEEAKEKIEARFACFMRHRELYFPYSVFTALKPFQRYNQGPLSGSNAMTCFIRTNLDSTTAVWVIEVSAFGENSEGQVLFVDMGPYPSDGHVFDETKALNSFIILDGPGLEERGHPTWREMMGMDDYGQGLYCWAYDEDGYLSFEFQYKNPFPYIRNHQLVNGLRCFGGGHMPTDQQLTIGKSKIPVPNFDTVDDVNLDA